MNDPIVKCSNARAFPGGIRGRGRGMLKFRVDRRKTNAEFHPGPRACSIFVDYCRISVQGATTLAANSLVRLLSLVAELREAPWLRNMVTHRCEKVWYFAPVRRNSGLTISGVGVRVG